MSKKLKILFISAEVAPFAKTGGLGDVVGSLPKALSAMGHDVRVVMPAYANIEAGYPGIQPVDITLNIPFGPDTFPAGLFEGTLPDSKIPVYFIGEWNLFNRDKIYGYGDDVYRFAFFSRAALEIIPALGWKPDIIHAHDWHTAPAITWLSTAGQGDEHFRGISTIFTIHNLAHQGKTTWDIFNYMGLHTHRLAEEGYNEVNFMARGIYHATMVNTVSPTYAYEITTPPGGAGLDSLLRHRQFDLHGILNGIDYDVWDPLADGRIASPFNVKKMKNRLHNRHALQTRLNLPLTDNIPLIAMVSRLDWQKGLDILGHSIHLLMNGYCGNVQFVILGTGNPEYEHMLANFAHYHQGKMAAYLSYDADLASLFYAGSDMFLMPSLFEPCGLSQLIAMHYGSVPVARATGGLADTIQDGESGFLFHDYNADALWHAIQRAIYVYNVDRPRWQQIQKSGMTADFSWDRSAQGYEQLYEWAIARTYA